MEKSQAFPGSGWICNTVIKLQRRSGICANTPASGNYGIDKFQYY